MGTVVATTEVKNSVARYVYETLRARILKGDLKSGDILSEVEVARELNVSRTPVHDALRRLGAEGIVDIAPRRRARVVFVTPTDVSQIYEIRGQLEGLAASNAARAISEESIARLEAATSEMEEVVNNWEAANAAAFIDAFGEANKRFHLEILRAAENRWLEKTFGAVLDLALGPVNSVASIPAPRISEAPQDHLIRNCVQHREIIVALKAHDPDWAGAAMRLHVLSAHHDWHSFSNGDVETSGPPSSQSHGKKHRKKR